MAVGPTSRCFLSMGNEMHGFNLHSEMNKVCIVFDASARENSEAASLNECVEVGPSLQNQYGMLSCEIE